MADFDKNLTASWTGSMLGSGSIDTYGFTTGLAIPPQLGGSGMGAGPMDLLVGSAMSCYLMTLVAMLEGRKIPVDTLTVESDASTAKDGVLAITHHAQLNLAEAATAEQRQTAEALISKADSACHVGNLLKKAGVKISATGAVAK